jgi:hypothetical protein
MTEQEKQDLFVAKVIRLTEEYDVTSLLHFYVNGNGKLEVSANCSDTFIWGCADSEEITPENFDLYKRTLEECNALGWGPNPKGQECYAVNASDELFAARVRGMRPQGASYELYPINMHKLFDACGPERKVGLGNPHPQPKVSNAQDNQEAF